MNVSEGRDASRIGQVAGAIEAVPEARLLDVCSDPDHHRSVFSFIGNSTAVLTAAWAAIEVAVTLIDLRTHQGVHPRIGAVDVVPFVPLRNSSMSRCIELARRLGRRVAEELRIPVYLYAEAAEREDRLRLSSIRRGNFEGLREAIRIDPSRAPDFGPTQLHPTSGAMAVGARELLIAFNVFLETEDVGVARTIARTVRERDGGLPAVKALGLWIARRGQAQVSMNLTDFHRTPPRQAYEQVKAAAGRLGVQVAGSEIVGLAPRAALGSDPQRSLQLEHFSPGQVLEDRIEEVLK